jgi:hypothetical protein
MWIFVLLQQVVHTVQAVKENEGQFSVVKIRAFSFFL